MLKRFVKQTHVSGCFAAAVASLLDLDLEDLPHHKRGVNLGKIRKPRSRWTKWAEHHGYVIRQSVTYPIDRLYIGHYDVGPANMVHAVVCYNGMVLHDPATDGYDLLGFKHALWFEKG